MKNAIKLILEIMFKIYFGTLVGLALLFLLFYGIGKIYFSPLNTLSSRWDITIPKQTKVEEYYSSDHGFHGDGYRIIKLSCKNDKVCGSVFDFSSSNYSPRSIHDDDLRVIDTTCSKLRSKQGNKEDFLPSNHTLLVKTLKQFDNTLVIVYSTEDDLYYLFEELI